MIGEHYEDWELFAYEDANADIVDLVAIAAHLAGCEECNESLDAIRTLAAILRDPDVHAAAARRPRRADRRRVREAQAFLRRAEQEKHEANETFDKLMRLPVDAWATSLASMPTLRTEALVERIVREARAE